MNPKSVLFLVPLLGPRDPPPDATGHGLWLVLQAVEAPRQAAYLRQASTSLPFPHTEAAAAASLHSLRNRKQC